MSRHRAIRTAALAAAGLAAIATVNPGALAVTQPVDPPSAQPSAPPAPVDVRNTATALLKPTQAQVDAVSAVLAGAGSGARVTWDGRYGTPRTIRPAVGAALSGPRSGTAVEVARAWLTEHRAMLGLSRADIAAMTVRRDDVLPGSGTRVVDLTRVFGGIPAARGGSAGLAIASDGRVLSYTGSTSRTSALLGAFDLSPLQAVSAVANVLAPLTSYAPVLSCTTQAGYQVVEAGPFAAPSYVKASVFGTGGGGRASYRVLFVKALDEAYDVLVDASTGQVLYQRDLVQHETGGLLDPEGTVYRNYPGAPKGGTPEVVSFGRTPQSPNGWVDPAGLLGTGITTFGNNANSHANWSNFLAPVDAGPRPVNPLGKFDYAFTDQWGTQQCAVP